MASRLTHEQVVDMVGPLDDLRIAEIMTCGASAAELIEAQRWAQGYRRSLGDAQPIRPAVVSQVCDILRAEEPIWYEH